MILSIYKTRLFRYLIYFFICVIFNGCTAQYLIKDYGSPDLDIPSVEKVYLTDGRVIDFTDRTTENTLIKVTKEDLTYKNLAGGVFTISTKEITRGYEKHSSPMNTILCVLGILASVFLGLVIWFAASFHGGGFA
jgi:hypothetical protein